MKAVAIENPRRRQEELGQFLTATPVADFMASMFGPLPSVVRLLDAGAGAGCTHRRICFSVCAKNEGVRAIEATLYELDREILDALAATMRECERRCAGRQAFASRSPFTPPTSSRKCRHVSRVICSAHRRPRSMPPSRIRPIAKSAPTPPSGAPCVPSASKPATSTPASSPSFSACWFPAGNSSASRHGAFAMALTSAHSAKIS